jgi:SagB-type dehydrogenase family enzyme
MPQFHQQTKHSFNSVRKNAFFLDWRSQPKNYKTYPHFYPRFDIRDFEYRDLSLIGEITYKKEYSDGTYFLRTVPSAGGLYPCEVYIQIRSQKGYIDGIYHYEPLSNKLTLLYEISDDGVESYFGDISRENGFIFFVSSVYFRSSWKYRDRSIRYILLDSGHQLGAIYASMCVMDRDSKLCFDFDKLSLNQTFGFREDEMFCASLKSTTKSNKDTKMLKQNMPYICASDYLEKNIFIEEAYKESVEYDSSDIKDIDFFSGIDKDELKSAIQNRRSIRAFVKDNILLDEFEFITKDIFDFALKNGIDIYYTTHRVKGLQNGLYQNGELIEGGEYSEKSKYLSLEQKLGGDSAFTLYFTSSSTTEYQKVNILSGFLAHIIYLRATLKNIGCSGIGAYYDDECKAFLNTPNNILYLLAVGR